MPSPNFANRTLFHSDNLPILQGMNSETVDLIATDPPFNKGRDFHATPESLASGARFQDRWSWDMDVHEEWTDAIQDDYPEVWSVIQFARRSYGDDMGAFLCFMGVRLMEMRRVLKPTGSLYLHCDPTASHYLKAMCDAVFGRDQFKNEIVWLRKQGERHNLARKRMPSAHDVVLYYVKTAAASYSPQFTPYSEEYIAKNYKYSDERGRYSTFPCTNESGGNRPYEFRGVTRAWRFAPERMEAMYNDGMLVQARPGGPFRYKKYLDEDAGVKVDDVWLDVPQVRPGKEKVGYPTQKPLALYERIIRASSNPGGMVLDPFAGCATTPIAAERLGRQWVGIDLWDGAYDIVRRRMEDSRQLLADPDPIIHYATEPPVRTDDADEPNVPNLRLRVQRPVLAWQKLSRKQMAGILGEAQASPSDPRLIICAGCGRAMEMAFMELDHIQPKSERGSNAINNRILLCGPCNREKGANRTLSGLIADNRKSGWMVDAAGADSARIRADRMAERVELEWDSAEIQALVGKYR